MPLKLMFGRTWFVVVRGVNRNIIEINCTENKYFNKVILFVDPACNQRADQLERRAGEYVKFLTDGGFTPKATPRNRAGRYSVIAAVLLLLAAASAVAAVCLL